MPTRAKNLPPMTKGSVINDRRNGKNALHLSSKNCMQDISGHIIIFIFFIFMTFMTKKRIEKNIFKNIYRKKGNLAHFAVIFYRLSFFRVSGLHAAPADRRGLSG